MGDGNQAPPRNGEGDRAQHGGGVLSARAKAFAVVKRERRSGNLPEVLIWRELRKRPGGYKFRRQHPLGNFVLDFVCLERRLVIEIDGISHDMGDRPERDEHRAGILTQRGFKLLRLPAQDVLAGLESAILGIVAACDAQSPLHHQPLAGGPPPRSGEVF